MARTRSVQAHTKVLEASLELFAEQGIDATSMDAIAAASGVSKATIYKHWQDKSALALEALALLFGMHEEEPKFDSGDLQRDFVDALIYQPTQSRQEMKNRMMPHVMAYAARDQAFGEAWRSRMLERPRERIKVLLKRGVSQRQLRKDLNPETSLALLFGPTLYWHIFVGRKTGRAVPRELAADVVSAFWKAFGRNKPVSPEDK